MVNALASLTAPPELKLTLKPRKFEIQIPPAAAGSSSRVQNSNERDTAAPQSTQNVIFCKNFNICNQTSPEDLGAATFKLVNFVDQKV